METMELWKIFNHKSIPNISATLFTEEVIHELNLTKDQGGQIGRFLAYWLVVLLWQFYI
jgi:hypothetical protein